MTSAHDETHAPDPTVAPARPGRAPWSETARATWRGRLGAVLAAAVAGAVVWLLAVPLLGVDLVAPAGPGSTALEEVPIAAVLMSAIVAGLAGWAGLALLEAVTRHARTVWTVVAAALLLLSFAPVLNPDLPGESRVVLGLLHLAVGGTIIAGLRRAHADR